MRYVVMLAVLISAAATSGPAPAADEEKASRKPVLFEKDAGEDFPFQGEYSGMIGDGDDKQKLGIQVIALGGGKFAGVGYPGGLPGDGWNGEEKIEAKGELKDGIVLLVNPERGRAEISGETAKVFDKDGTLVGEVKKVHRKSPTLGRKPPEGAVVLFDGSTADGFKNGRLADDKTLMQGCTSKETFQSFKLHMEFKLSYMPYARGQGRSNSGCYMQGRYEVQVLDSFGLAGKHNECGGIYSVKDPDVNMCLPPLAWQTYDVEYTAAKYDATGKKTANARMTVRHNGVLIHEDVELPKGTTAHPVKEGPEPGPIYLQNHGNPLRYRNIWVVATEN